jgi:hypothetical protein
MVIVSRMLTAIHQAPAVAAEVVGHGVAGLDGGARRVGLDLVFAADIFEGLVFDGEVGAEGRSAQVAAVEAIADELDEQCVRDGERGQGCSDETDLRC